MCGAVLAVKDGKLILKPIWLVIITIIIIIITEMEWWRGGGAGEEVFLKKEEDSEGWMFSWKGVLKEQISFSYIVMLYMRNYAYTHYKRI